ncbi:MAG: phage shock protein E [Paracrocinitomix sp.]|jgi:phage shock protein E
MKRFSAKISLRRPIAVLLLASFAALVAACGGDTSTGIRAISPDQAFETVFESPPDGLVVLDVRTQEEFDGQRLPDATLIDFYSPDFAALIADLDRDTPYLLYCRSGNRSGQTAALMDDLGFADVRDVDGGILSWLDSGHPFVTSNG